MAAAGIEVLSGGSETHFGNDKVARAGATGPALRVKTADGRKITDVLGQAVAVAKHPSKAGHPRRG